MGEREKIIGIIQSAKYCDTNNRCEECEYDKESENCEDMSCGSLRAADALLAANIGDVTEYKHRAEVAERALVLMACGECTFASPEFYKEEAEKEIAMEEQMMANRCGEGKCEYFESIRRATNNNRGNGYCKKYKRQLLLYDWWWLKCDECTAEKELADEKDD